MGCDEAATTADAEEAATVGLQLRRDSMCISASLAVNVVPTVCIGRLLREWRTVFISHDKDALSLFWISC